MTPSALHSRRLETGDMASVQELFHANGWTDGLPVVPPTPLAVERCLAFSGHYPTDALGIEPVRARPILAEKLAINAVMAGCLPEHFPVVVASIKAILSDGFRVHGAVASTSGNAPLLIINGPIRQSMEAPGTFNVLGNADRATTVIGRAIRLAMINLLDAHPGTIDRATLGHPGKFSYCVSENEEDSPWPSVATLRGVAHGQSAVTAISCGAPRQILNEWTKEPREILETFAAEMRANMRLYSIWAGNYVLIIPKQLRDHLTGAGWSKADVAAFIYKRARIYRKEWRSVGKGAVVRDRGDTEHTAIPTPDDLIIVAAGGPAGGFGAVIPPQNGAKNRAVTVSIEKRSARPEMDV